MDSRALGNPPRTRCEGARLSREQGHHHHVARFQCEIPAGSTRFGQKNRRRKRGTNEMDSTESSRSAEVIDRRTESGNARRLRAGCRRAGVESDSIHERGLPRFDRQISAGWKRCGFLERLDRHIEAGGSSVMHRASRHRSSAAEELELIAPSKLAIENVSKNFKGASGAVLALDRVSLNVAEGEFVCLVGASGCGKTTLLNIIAGLEKPDTGTGNTDGKPASGPGRERLVMFQEAALFPWLNVFGNVLFGLKLKPNLTNKDRHDVAKYYLELVGLSRFERANIHELSGGMKQRVSLARALAPNPRMLLMDEPFAALDALTREQLYGDIQEIWKARRKTIVFVTHNVREAACLGDRVLLFSPHPGRVQEEFVVNLPRPRDINTIDLAAYATRITKALKGLGKTATG